MWDNIEVLEHLDTMECEATDNITGVKGTISEVCFEAGGGVKYKLEWLVGETINSWWVNAGRVTTN